MSVPDLFSGVAWNTEFGFGALTVSQRLKPFEVGKERWTSTMREQVQTILDDTGESEASMAPMEMLEVGLKQGPPVLHLYFFPYEDGAAFVAGSVQRFGGFSQGGFDFQSWPETAPEMVRAFRLLLDLAAAVNPLADAGTDIGCFSPQGYLSEVLDEGVDLFEEPTLSRFRAECDERGIAIGDLAPDFDMFLANKLLRERVAEAVDGGEQAPQVLDAVAQWYAEDEYHKKLDPELADTVFQRLLLPVVLESKDCQEGWERLFPRHLPEEHGRALIESLDLTRRVAWLDANPQYADRLAAYIDRVGDLGYITRRFIRLRDKKKEGELRPKLAILERRLLELVETEPLFAEALDNVDEEL